MARGQDSITGDYNDFWAERDLMNFMKPFRAAVLMRHAFNDWKSPLHISVVPSVTIRASADMPAVNLSVWLVILPASTSRNQKITDNLIDRGWADLQNSASLTGSKPLMPGQFYEMTFDLEPDDQIIPAGKQIGLMICSSDKEFTLQPKPGARLTVDLDASSITIPVIGGAGGIKF